MAQAVRMLRLPEVVERTGLSQTTIWRREREGSFPRRRRLGSNLVGWRSDEVAQWIDALPEAGEVGEPEPAAS